MNIKLVQQKPFEYWKLKNFDKIRWSLQGWLCIKAENDKYVTTLTRTQLTQASPELNSVIYRMNVYDKNTAWIPNHVFFSVLKLGAQWTVSISLIWILIWQIINNIVGYRYSDIVVYIFKPLSTYILIMILARIWVTELFYRLSRIWFTCELKIEILKLKREKTMNNN